MLYAIFSDIHSNLQAYEAIVEDFKKEKVDKYLCVGDIVGYGANPRECIQLTINLNCPAVCGNHDLAAVGKISTENFTQHAKEAIFWTQHNVTEIGQKYLAELPFTYNETNFTLVHGSLSFPEEFNYVLSARDAADSISLQKTQLCFIGHSHIPGIFFKDERDHVSFIKNQQLTIMPKVLYLINVGSIGQPRDGNWRACYIIYDDKKNLLCFKRIEYDVKTASKAIIDAGLPRHLADRLKKGK